MTRHSPKILALTIAVLICGTGVQDVSGDHGRDSVMAHVFEFAGVDWELHARSSSVGTDVSGRFRVTVTSVDPNLVLAGEVTCLRVVEAGGQALFSAAGVITRQPAGFEARSFLVVGSDSGKFSTAADTFNGVVLDTPPPPECPTPSLGDPVADGEVVIHNTLP